LRGDESSARDGTRARQSGVGDAVACGPFSLAVADGGIELGAVAHRRLLGQVGQLREGQRGAGDVLGQADACGVILCADADVRIDGYAN
jgi:hypothetical protein